MRKQNKEKIRKTKKSVTKEPTTLMICNVDIGRVRVKFRVRQPVLQSDSFKTSERQSEPESVRIMQPQSESEFVSPPVSVE
eukprot:10145485-Karenia_brevis.AAC.1